MKSLFLILLFPFFAFSQAIPINGAGNALAINGSGTTVFIETYPQPLDIFNSETSSFEDAFNHTNDAELNVQPGSIEFDGTTSHILELESDNAILYHQFESWSVEMTFDLGELSVNEGGLFIGIMSMNLNQRTGFFIKGHGGAANRWFLQAVANGTNGSSIAGNSYTPGISVTVTLTRTLTEFSITVDDGISAKSLSFEVGFSPYASISMPAVVTRFALQFISGTFTVNNLRWMLPDSNLPFLFIGDSITQGQGASLLTLSYGQLLKGTTRSQTFGGRSSTTSDILLTLGSIKLIAPRKVTILLGINDILTSVSMGTIQSNYSAIIDDLLLNGIQVNIISTLPYNNSVVTLNNWLQSTYPSLAYIDAYTTLKDPSGLDMDAAYSDDGVHPNDAGHDVIYNESTSVL